MDHNNTKIKIITLYSHEHLKKTKDGLVHVVEDITNHETKYYY